MVVSKFLCAGVPELIDRRTEYRSRIVQGVVHGRRLCCRLLLTRLPSLDFGNHVPHRLRREVVH